MGLKDLISKHEGGKLKSGCEGCIFDVGDPKHCLIYLEEGGKEKPSSGCKHFKTGKEAVEIAQSDRADK
ncbi:MAG: hypothetical protein ACOX6U_09695 [Oscillospiraceae bacterium]